MKTTYTLGNRDDWYCITCWSLWKCIDRLFYNLKTYNYRDIKDYTIVRVKHPKNLTLDYGMGGDCYLLNKDNEIDEKNDDILSNSKIVNLKKSDLKFIKKHLPINQK